MNGFLHRLKYYVLGLGIGSLLVYLMLFRNREDTPAWTPNDRVIQELRLADLSIAPHVLIPFADTLLKAHIKESSVLFSESDVRSDSCRTYQLSSETERMRFRICGKEAQLVQYAAQP